MSALKLDLTVFIGLTSIFAVTSVLLAFEVLRLRDMLEWVL
jgi:hypothetical protein